MGNAACTIHHPTSLKPDAPYLEAGKVTENTGSVIRLEKRDGAATGCGGRIAFKRNVAESNYTYKITKTKSMGGNIGGKFNVGQEVTLTNKLEAKAKKTLAGEVAASFNISVTEARESLLLIKHHVSDDNKYSELKCYVDYNGQNNGSWEWTKNDLGLKANSRWGESSELIITITF